MSLTTDQDLELLETYADGELTTQEEDALRARLAAEPQLTALLESLRADRAVRAEVWKSFEPAADTVERLVNRVHGSVDRNTIWAARLSKLRVASSAAACILVGFLVGRVAYRTQPGTGNHMPSGPLTVVQVPSQQTGLVPASVSNVNAPVQFRIVDANNQPVGLQPFNSAQEAQEFIEDLRRWESQRQQIRNGSGVGGGSAPTSESF